MSRDCDGNHAICAPCWNALNPDRPARSTFILGPPEVCCWCGRDTTHGIYLRADPEFLRCGGGLPGDL